MDIEIYTDRYEREHGHKPQGRRFWRFTLVSSSITAKDHFLNPSEQMTYPDLRGVAHMTKIGDDPCRPLPIAPCLTRCHGRHQRYDRLLGSFTDLRFLSGCHRHKHD